MKHRSIILIAIVFGVLLAGIVVILSTKTSHDPRDLRYWVYAGGNRDWSSEAAQKQPESEFFHGVSFIRTNLMVMTDRVPWLSAVPLVGKRWFEKTHYEIDRAIPPEQLAAGYLWIKKSADHGFAPAKEAEKLFIGRVTSPLK
jgi:hypothetical protein